MTRRTTHTGGANTDCLIEDRSSLPQDIEDWSPLPQDIEDWSPFPQGIEDRSPLPQGMEERSPLPQPKPMTEGLIVVTRAYDLCREMTQRTRKLPRDLKFVLGDRMLSTTYDVLDLLVEARYSQDRRHVLRRANFVLERLRFQVRLCMEERLLSVRQYEYVAEMVDEVGRMVGGWLKTAEGVQDHER